MMRRILSITGSLWFVGVVAIGWVVLTGTLAIREPDPFFIALLMAWSILATVLFLASLKLSKSANDGYASAVRGWSEQESLTMDLTHLLGESLTRLSTWDRETADDIADRTNTIIRLRFQNFNERNHP